MVTQEEGIRNVLTGSLHPQIFNIVEAHGQKDWVRLSACLKELSNTCLYVGKQIDTLLKYKGYRIAPVEDADEDEECEGGCGTHCLCEEDQEQDEPLPKKKTKVKYK